MHDEFKLNSLEREVLVKTAKVSLNGILALPKEAKAVIIFAHGSGSGRFSSRNNFVARVLQKAGLGTLLMDLLSEEEAADRHNVFDIQLLALRLCQAKAWLSHLPETKSMKIGYFGASTGAAAAFVAAKIDPENVYAVVSRGGRPDLAGDALAQITVPSLLLVGGNDGVVIDLNQDAYQQLHCPKEIKIIPGATHLFEEPGTLEQVALLAEKWFTGHLTA